MYPHHMPIVLVDRDLGVHHCMVHACSRCAWTWNFRTGALLVYYHYADRAIEACMLQALCLPRQERLIDWHVRMPAPQSVPLTRAGVVGVRMHVDAARVHYSLLPTPPSSSIGPTASLRTRAGGARRHGATRPNVRARAAATSRCVLRLRLRVACMSRRWNLPWPVASVACVRTCSPHAPTSQPMQSG
jgi:hypothetical protein